MEKNELDTNSERGYIEKHFEKKLSQYLEKWQSDVNIKISYFLEQISEKSKTKVKKFDKKKFQSHF